MQIGQSLMHSSNMKNSDIRCLQFQDHSDTLIASLTQLRQDRDLCDVTLVSGDGQMIEAHRIILSASSGFFKRLLTTNINPRPIIYMRNVTWKILDCLLTFVYQGEVTIGTEGLEDFLALATEVQLKGLENISYSDSDNSFQSEISPIKSQNDSSLIPDLKYHTDYRGEEIQNTPEINIKIEETDNKINYTMLDKLKSEQKAKPRYTCSYPNCGYQNISNRQRTLKRHEYKTHQKRTTPVLCSSSFCTQIFDTRDEFVEHKKTCRLRCPYYKCGREFMRIERFESHKKVHQMGKEIAKNMIKHAHDEDEEKS